MRFGVAVALLIAVLGAGSALAQPGRRAGRPASVPPHLVMERLSRMTPQERDNLLGSLPAERRTLLEKRLQKYNEMPEPAKQRLRDEYSVFQQLPPEKQDDMRKLFKQLGEYPDDRRQAIRRELVRLRNMSPERRAKRLQSPKFKEEFDEGEREFLGSLTELLTHVPPASHSN